MSTLHSYNNGNIMVFDKWLSIKMGSTVEFEPLGMWGDRVWQNKRTYVCTGIKRPREYDGLYNSLYTYRFTQVGDGSVGEEFSDLILNGADLGRWYENNSMDSGEIRILGLGYIMLGDEDVRE